MQLISKIIEDKRISLGLSLETLSNGLCHFTFLRKIESGDLYADNFLINALLQRLGINDSFEHFIWEDDAYVQELRIKILDNIDKMQFGKVKMLMQQYVENVDMTLGIHKQYYQYIKILLNHTKIINLQKEYEKIIKITVPNFNEKPIDELLLCNSELFLIIEYTKLYLKSDPITALARFIEIFKYLRKTSIESGIASIFLPVVAIDILDHCIKENMYQSAYIICEKTFEILANSICFDNLVNLLERKIIILNKLPVIDDFNILKQYNALNTLYKKNKVNITEESLRNKVFSLENFHLISNTIKTRRLMIGMTQAELAKDICDIKTISRIENNKTKMHTRNVSKLLVKLGLSGQMCSECIVTSQYDHIALAKKIKLALNQDDFKNANIYINELTKVIDCKNKINLQFINHRKYIVSQYTNLCDIKDSLENYKNTLKLTLSINNLFKAHKLQLTNRECNLIINIICCLNSLDKVKEMEKWFKVLENFYNDDWHLASYWLYLNVLYNLKAQHGDYQKSKSIFKKLIKKSLESQWFFNLHYLVYGEAKYFKLEIEETRSMTNKEQNKYEEMIKIALVICELIGSEYLHDKIINENMAIFNKGNL